MKPLKVKNEYGETIEIKFNADGVIKIRHSDIDPKFWGELREISKRMREPGVKGAMERRGITAPTQAEGCLKKLGGYIMIRDKMAVINSAEVDLIHEAVKKAGGIVPNWSSH
jgi:hypothetical protein